ncbi:MAG: family 78 glycoside hydrolase catalytic domain, partial [Verrucomicrobiota bacterium]
VYDFGQNFAGWPEVTLQGTAGVAVKLTPGELLDATGVVNQTSMGSPVWFTYTLKGGGAPETWHPRFSYTGFRYIQVDAAAPAAQAASFPARPQITALTGQAISASAETVGQFSSSDADLNHIHALILAAFRSNLQNVLTDCPHREKLGWLETAHLLATGIMYNFDVAAFYEKIIRDMRDGQTTDGLIPDIAPEMTVFAGAFRDSPEWGSAYILGPWRVYQMYGDRQPLAEHYANMKRYVTYLAGKATGNILGYGLGDWYDVGPAAPGASQLTTAGVTATAIWLEDMQVMQQAATLLGNTADATQYQSTIATVTNAFNAKFLSANGTFDRGSQTGQAMPIALGLVPDAQRAGVIAHLVSSVTSAQNRVTAGDVGFRYLVHALSQAGRDDVMFSMVKQSAGPGYLYQINRGATALTEAWDANPADSQNHAMLGHAEEWLYSGLGGISTDPAAPGWRKFIVRPQPQTGVASVNVQYHSIQGPIASAWQRGAGTAVTYSITIPPNTIATVTIPTTNPAGVTEGGVPATTAPGITAHTTGTSTLELVAGSGSYVFIAP